MFSAPTGGYLWVTTILRRELYPAMVDAKVPREGPTGGKRTFHSFRHTFAKLAMENGRQMTWLSKHLGHSSLIVTSTVYGHFGVCGAEARGARDGRRVRGLKCAYRCAYGSASAASCR